MSEQRLAGTVRRVIHRSPDSGWTILSFEPEQQSLWASTVSAVGIVEAFGTNTPQVIENEPDRLTEVSGISQNKATMIAQVWKEQAEQRYSNLARRLEDHAAVSA